jgi:hypothetical protein
MQSTSFDLREPTVNASPALEGVATSEATELLRQMLNGPVTGAPSTPAQVVTGHLQGIDDEGRVLFVPEQGGGAPVPVSIGIAISDGALIPAARNQQRALAVRTSENPPLLVLIGLVRERVASTARDAAPGQLEVKVDGETLRLTAEREIELRCGNASLTLRQSGRVILKGTHVVTSSRGPLKIKGATVEIN